MEKYHVHEKGPFFPFNFVFVYTGLFLYVQISFHSRYFFPVTYYNTYLSPVDETYVLMAGRSLCKLGVFLFLQVVIFLGLLSDWSGFFVRGFPICIGLFPGLFSCLWVSFDNR